MASIEILYIQGALVLRMKRSELLIVPKHVEALIKIEEPQKFSQYFYQTALVNRSARKLFEAWLRKDAALWPSIYKRVHGEAKEDYLEQNKEKEAEAEEAKEEAATSEKKEAAPKKKAAAKKTATKKKVAKKSTTSKATTKKKATKKASS